MYCQLTYPENDEPVKAGLPQFHVPLLCVESEVLIKSPKISIPTIIKIKYQQKKTEPYVKIVVRRSPKVRNIFLKLKKKLIKKYLKYKYITLKFCYMLIFPIA